MSFSETRVRELDRLASRGILVLGAIVGTACLIHYYRLGLTVAHYDAKAHLVVARRIVDSLAPGYGQMGVDWLPLIHLLYLPFVIFDSQYRTGLLPSLISVVSFSFSAWLVFRIAFRATGSIAAGVSAGVLLLANPNLEYLQSCPLTEPVYMLLQLLSLDALMRWRDGNGKALPWAAAVWASLGAMCRYEGWYFVGGAILLCAWDYWQRSLTGKLAAKAVLTFAGTFALPAAAHFGYIYLRLGDTFVRRVAQGSASPYETYRRPILAVVYHAWELCQACGIIPLLFAGAGILMLCVERDKFKRRVPLFLLWLPSLINVSALYWGMIYRVRYSILLVPAVAVCASLVFSRGYWARRAMVFASLATMILPWLSWASPHEWKYHDLTAGPGIGILPVAALILLLFIVARNGTLWPLLALSVLAMQVPVLSGENRAILAETREHDFIEPERQKVLQFLKRNYDGTRIMIDMGKLAPLVYDSGLPVREFVYNEGSNSYWYRALRQPQKEVGWLVAQKGDEIWARLRVDPTWADAYAHAVDTEYFEVYRLKSTVRDSSLPARRYE
jgi:hypothetical protein